MVRLILKKEIQYRCFFERKSGLAELAKILTSDNEDLYEKLVKDLAETETSFRNWWSSMSVKYAWESADNGSWEIDFSDCNIYIVTPE